MILHYPMLTLPVCVCTVHQAGSQPDQWGGHGGAGRQTPWGTAGVARVSVQSVGITGIH